MSRRLSIALLAVTYFGLATLSIIEFGTATPIWFSNAVAVVWLLRNPSRHWPLLCATVWIADTLAIRLFGSMPPESLSIAAALMAVADVGETLLTAALIRRFGGPAVALSSVAGMVRLIAICLGVPLLSAAWGAGLLVRLEGASFVASYWQWYGGTTLGLLIALPALLIWFTPELRPRLSRAELHHTLVLAAAVAALGAVVLTLATPPFLFVMFPALLLLVWSSGLAGASIGAVVLTIVGFAQTFAGAPAIEVMVYPETDATSRVQALQITSRR